MNPLAEWKAENALLAWILSLALGMLAGDLAWQWHARHDARSIGHRHFPLRRHAGRRLAMLLFALVALAAGARPPGELPRFNIALARSLHAQLPLPLRRRAAMLTHLGDVLWIAPVATLLLAILLRVHYFNDVLAGYANGAAWLLLCMGVAEYLRGNTTLGAGNPCPEALP
jgi:membrane-associated phospholipid phosphatase